VADEGRDPRNAPGSTDPTTPGGCDSGCPFFPGWRRLAVPCLEFREPSMPLHRALPALQLGRPVPAALLIAFGVTLRGHR